MKFLDFFVASKVLVFFEKGQGNTNDFGKSSMSSLVTVKNLVYFRITI